MLNSWDHIYPRILKSFYSNANVLEFFIRNFARTTIDIQIFGLYFEQPSNPWSHLSL